MEYIECSSVLRLVLPSNSGSGLFDSECTMATSWNVTVDSAAIGCVREAVFSL